MDDSDNRARSWFFDATVRDQVRGYLHRTQAQAIGALLDQQSRAGLRGALAEIGLYFGKTFIGLARASRDGEKVVGVDPLRIGAQDLQPEGVAGDAASATPEHGALAARYGVAAFIDLLRDIHAFELSRLKDGPLKTAGGG